MSLSRSRVEKVVQIHKLEKNFGAHRVLNQLDFELRSGEIFGLLGPNGCGKTTLVKILSGLLNPRKGKVCVLGHTYEKDRIDIYKKIGVFLDEQDHFAELTLYEHLLLEARIRKIERGKETCESFLRFFDLWDRKDRLAVHGSKGMKKKLGLCLALLHRPLLVLLDEPFEGLDPVASQQLCRILQSLKKLGSSVFMTSHTLHLLPGLLDRTGFLSGGRIVEQETASMNHQDLVLRYGAYYPSEGSKSALMPWE